MMLHTLSDTMRWLVFPGANLHARLRYKVLPRNFERVAARGSRTVIDAGCGNGMLSYKSYLAGNRVIGLSIKQSEVDKCRRLFNVALGIPEDLLCFRNVNIYDIASVDGKADEIICSEVLEHLSKDREVIDLFAAKLGGGGVLHLCVPNKDHPDHKTKELDCHEHGGHVRSGYTLGELSAMLEAAGLAVETTAGIGGPIRQAFNKVILPISSPYVAFPLAIMASAFTWLDPASPRLPYSIYVKARKTT